MKRAVKVGAAVLAGAMVGGLGAGWGRMFAMPTDAPVERLVSNIGAYVKEHPQDAHAHYLLGRVHALAYINKSKTVAHYGVRDETTKLPELAERSWGSGGGAPPTQKELDGHLARGVEEFERAADLVEEGSAPRWGETEETLVFLGYAYLLDAGAEGSDGVEVVPRAPRPMAAERRKDAGDAKAGEKKEGAAEELGKEEREKIEGLIKDLGSEKGAERSRAAEALGGMLAKAAPLLAAHRKDENKERREAVRTLLRAWWWDAAIEYYTRVVEATVPRDVKLESQPIRGLQELASYEASMALARLMKARGVKTPEQKAKLAKVEDGLAKLRAVPPSYAITPVVFSLAPSGGVGDLLEAGSRASFDLRGVGAREWWPWVKPTTGFLVWDPEDKQKIVSGRQLFGSVTWWMMFEHGYQALDMLDDDRDGRLSGAELKGLAAWFDEDGDGVCQRSEVRSLRELGVEWISVRVGAWEGGMPLNRRGIGLRGGAELPTYDWITGPAEASEAEEPTAAGRAP